MLRGQYASDAFREREISLSAKASKVRKNPAQVETMKLGKQWTMRA